VAIDMFAAQAGEEVAGTHGARVVLDAGDGGIQVTEERGSAVFKQGTECRHGILPVVRNV
jgi:hypothetical protein